MCTTKSMWDVSQFLNLLFKNDKELNVCSSSALDNTYTHAISTTFMNLESFVEMDALLVSLHRNHDITFLVMGKDVVA